MWWFYPTEEDQQIFLYIIDRTFDLFKWENKMFQKNKCVKTNFLSLKL